jgi:hypothetical protein
MQQQYPQHYREKQYSQQYNTDIHRNATQYPEQYILSSNIRSNTTPISEAMQQQYPQQYIEQQYPQQYNTDVHSSATAISTAISAAIQH